MKAFVDTSGFAALYNAKDQHHQESKAIWVSLQLQKSRLYTTHDVIAETIILIRKRVGHSLAVQCGEDLWSSPILSVEYPNPAIDKKAWQIFKKYRDKEFSFVDCLSFAVMETLALEYAFSFDENFTQAGFTVLKA